MKHSVLLLVFFTLNAQLVFASAYNVGSSRIYTSPNALYLAGIVENGDTILIDAEDYMGNNSLAVWIQDDLHIQGIGGRPHLIAEGAAIWGKGIWVCAGNNITIDNIEFSGATVPDKNGAGIRLDGSGITVTDCYFHNNENGILTNNTYSGTITIEQCEFGANGFTDGYSHNLYIGHCDKLIFRFNYTHHSKIGHCIKSRAAENIILYNRIMDEDSGSSSRLLDIPNGGFSLIMGNIFMQGPNAENINAIGYGLEGIDSNKSNKFLFVNNTLISKRGENATFFHINNETDEIYIANNIFAGQGQLNTPSFATIENNIIEEDIHVFLFTDETNFDYNIYANSPAVDAGIEISNIDDYSLTPEYSYAHNSDFTQRQTSGTGIDIGAYEYIYITAIHNLEHSDLIVAPNPAKSEFRIIDGKNNNHIIGLYDIQGRKIKDINPKVTTDISTLNSGIYYLKHNQNGAITTHKLIVTK